MKIINKIPEICFPRGDKVFLRNDFFENKRNVGCGELGTFLTIISLCGDGDYTTLDELMKCCGEPVEEILTYVKNLKENGYIETEEQDV